VERMNKGPAVAAPLSKLEQLEAFYTAEYLKQVKILVLLEATIEEAEDAVQKAMVRHRHILAVCRWQAPS